MQKSILAKMTAAVLTVIFAVVLSSVAASAASEFEGSWKVKDTKGNPFEMTLSADGSAKANRAGEGMTGTWKEESGAAVISWTNTGWTAKITKEGNKYKKSSWDKGQPLSGPPTNSSDAEKAK